MRRTAAILLACFSFMAALPLFCGIDLMAMKKKEDERRKQITKSKIKITDANVNSISVGKKKYGFVQMESDEPPVEGEVEEAAAPDAAVKAKADPTKQPEYWQEQQARLQERIATLRTEIEASQLELNKLWSEYYIKNVAAEQQVIREQISSLTEQIEQKKLMVSEAEAQLLELLETARKAGVPPGWLR